MFSWSSHSDNNHFNPFKADEETGFHTNHSHTHTHIQKMCAVHPVVYLSLILELTVVGLSSSLSLASTCISNSVSPTHPVTLDKLFTLFSFAFMFKTLVRLLAGGWNLGD